MATNQMDSENNGSNSPFPTAESAESAASQSGGTQPTELLNRFVAGAHQAIDRFATQAGPKLERWNQGVQTAGTRLRERADKAGAMSEDFGETVRTTVRDRPLAAIGTAFAIGFLLAKLTR
jgi:ElaB/YqjD/DUF883 family membrane-anchored ribosome-binding protein